MCVLYICCSRHCSCICLAVKIVSMVRPVQIKIQTFEDDAVAACI